MTTVGIVGAGRMGSGIAALAIHRGVSVIATDIDPSALEELPDVIDRHRFVARRRKIGAADQPGQLTTSLSIAAMGAADLVIEAVVEKTPVKQAVLAELVEVTDFSTVIASNTSGIPISELTAQVADPDRASGILGVHFMDPPLLIRSAELVRAERTSERAVSAASQVLSEMSVAYQQVADVPLMVINALIQAFIARAARLAQDGVATVDVIDDLVKSCLRHPMGPFELAELIGLPNVVDTLDEGWAHTQDPAYRAPELLRDAAARGHFLRATGPRHDAHAVTPSTQEDRT